MVLVNPGIIQIYDWSFQMAFPFSMDFPQKLFSS
jgi:hypothetical protein